MSLMIFHKLVYVTRKCHVYEAFFSTKSPGPGRQKQFRHHIRALKNPVHLGRSAGFRESREGPWRRSRAVTPRVLSPTQLPMTGPELRNFRKALHLSQKEFGKILSVTRSTIARAETMQKLSRIMTLSLDQALRDGKLREKRSKDTRQGPRAHLGALRHGSREREIPGGQVQDGACGVG